MISALFCYIISVTGNNEISEHGNGKGAEGMKRFLSILLALVLLIGCTGAIAEGTAGSFRYEGNGFDTPEEAALWYLAGLKNGDFEQALSAFAWETQAEHFNFKAQITRAKGIDLSYVPGMPATGGLLTSAMAEQLRTYQANVICTALEIFVNDELYVSRTNSVALPSEEETDAYFLRCDNGRIGKLAEMDNIRIYMPDAVTDGKFSMEHNQKAYLSMNAKYGADETKDVVVAADIGGETWMTAPTAARYGDRWYLVSTGSMTTNILGINMYTVAFFPLPEGQKELLEREQPVMTAAALPESGGTGIRYEGNGFATPEEAVACYVEGLRNGNVQQMLSAFAWETQIARYSLKDYCLYYHVITPYAPVRMPSLNPLTEDANVASMRYQTYRKIYFAIRTYMLEEEAGAQQLLNGTRVDLKDEEAVDAFIRMFDNDRAERLKTLGEIRMINPADSLEYFMSDQYTDRMETLRKICGADEIMETVAYAEMDGDTLVCNPLLARYGERWYMVAAGSTAFAYLAIEANRQAFLVVKGSFEEAMNPQK